MQTPSEEKRRNRARWHLRWMRRAQYDMQALEFAQEGIEEDERWARDQIAQCGSLGGVGDPTEETFFDYPTTDYTKAIMPLPQNGLFRIKKRKAA